MPKNTWWVCLQHPHSPLGRERVGMVSYQLAMQRGGWEEGEGDL